MFRSALALALGFSLVALSGVASGVAQEKKSKTEKTEKEVKATTLEGKMVCGKCKLSETDACSNVLIVKKDDKEVKYYLNDKGKAEKYHKCSGEADVKVVGKVTEKEKKFHIDDAKVEAAKK